MKLMTINFQLFLVSFLIFSLSSCGESSSDKGPQMNTEDGLKEIQVKIAEGFGEDVTVYELGLTATGDMSSTFSYAFAKYIKDGKDQSQSISKVLEAYSLSEPQLAADSFQKEFYIKKKQGKKKIADLDFGNVYEQFETAKILMDDGFENVQLNSYTFFIDNDNNVTAEFKLQATKKGEDTTVEGRMEITNFYESLFKVAADGTVRAN